MKDTGVLGNLPEDAIAIVGLAGRFPGAPSAAAFWQAVVDGRDLVEPHPAHLLRDAFTDAERSRGDYVPVRPSLDDADLFDAAFFGMFPREAALTDPQHRIFLEICWEALEDAGYDPARPPGPVGVYAGSSLSTYFLNNVLADRAAVEDYVSTYQLGDYTVCSGAQADTLATRVAFRLGLTGPAMAVSSACSTSLTAVAQACLGLQTYQCDMALAGGVSITFPQERGYFYQEGGMASKDGHCRPFDAEATGTVFGHGAGAVVLRRLADAVAAGDNIYAVIRGVGMNNDGADKIAFTAPSVIGQAGAVAQAQAMADVTPQTISYLECHGTGTPLGDPIEIEALRQVFADVPRGRVALGSAKANVGHLDAAAGVASLIKVASMLRSRMIPPLANFTRPNARIDLEASPFYVPQAARPWQADAPFRAGVSSFGVGGTNVHLVLEEPPASGSEPEADGLHVLPLSARSDAALESISERLAEVLERSPPPSLSDVAFTLQEGRHAFPVRRAVVASSPSEAAGLLRAKGKPVTAAKHPVPVVFMFPGQGAQYPGMGEELYRSEPAYSEVIDAGAEALEPRLGLDIRDVLFPKEGDTDGAARMLRDTAVTQPGIFLTSLAAARLWQARGVEPTAMIGHSVGEFVAATLAGVMDFETALVLISERGRLMQGQPGGSMLAVRASVEELAPLVTGDIDLAARNAPRMNVYAGPTEAIDAFEAKLAHEGLATTRLHTSHAFHSSMMDPAAEALAVTAASLTLAPPSLPYVSCVTGAWISASDATNPEYWARHCRAPVNFVDALRCIAAHEGVQCFLEVGPGRALGAFAAQSLPRESVAAILQSLPGHSDTGCSQRMMASACGGLWAAGAEISWKGFRAGNARRIGLPTYPFERTRHWIDAPVPLARRTGDALPASAAGDLPAPTTLLGFVPDEVIDVQQQSANRISELADRIVAILEDLSGDSIPPEHRQSSFLELGYDSLLLGQVAQRLSREIGATLSFRQLLTDLPTVAALAEHLDALLPSEDVPATDAPAPSAAGFPPQAPATPAPHPPSAAHAGHQGTPQGLMESQTQAMLALFDLQLRALHGPAQLEPARPGKEAGTGAKVGQPATPAALADKPTPATAGEGTPSRFDLNRRNGPKADFTAEQKSFISDLCAEYSARFAGSKRRTQEHRDVLADPRTASGFRSEWKELVFPIVAEYAHGSRITDIDGNVFIDLVNGFGQTAFGHAPAFVTKAIAAQMEKGFAIGPQTPLAQDVARRLSKITGHERITFCNTGSEAVMAAMRVARTVTGNDVIVTFKDDYHGQFDEVLVKGRAGSDHIALPAAAGVPRNSVSNMVVLPYGSPEALDWVRGNADRIAGVLVEPIQSRNPEFQPRDFVKELRRITAQSGSALILDEVVTGFRVAPGGVQELWGIRADLASYGKLVAGGMPIGVLAGASRFMDALDGGYWTFGDESQPEVPPTFFAGTFVRHPLALAATAAVLDHLDGDGRALFERVAPRTEALVEELNSILAARGLARAVEGYSSWIEPKLWKLDARAALLLPLMRLGGVHVLDGYPWFFTTAHSESDFARVAEVFSESLDRLRAAGMFTSGAGAPLALPAVPRQVALTEPQKEVWMAAQLGDAASGVFIESVSVQFEGTLDVDALRRALNDVIARHDALRMRFSPSGEHAEVLPEVLLGLPLEEADPAGLADIVAEDARTPFDLVEGPLVRARLVRLAPEAHVLVLACHHIVCDGWSSYILLEDLATAYNARKAGKATASPPAASFAAYAANSAVGAPAPASIAFWKSEYEPAPSLPDLPVDFQRPVRRSFSGATHIHLIDAALTRSLKGAGSRAGATLFATLCGALAHVVSRLCGASDVVLAVPTAGQTLLSDERLVGHCVNLLPVRLAIQPGATAAGHLAATAAKVLDCFDHRDMTYGAIIRQLGLPGDLNRQPLSEIQFNLDQQPGDFGFDGLLTDSHSNPRAYTNFDLIFNVTESPRGLRIDLTYNTDVLSAETAERWCRHYQTVLEALAKDVERPLAELPLLTPQEEYELARLGEGEATPLPPYERIEAMFAAQLATRAGAVAVEDESHSLTYAELARESDRLAAAIQKVLPVPGGRVAVLVERSADTVVALLAVLKAGHAYVPLDPRHPQARLRAVLEAAEAGAVVHNGAAAAIVGGLELPLVDLGEGDPGATPAPAGQGDATAYVIFTSGSTGTPKGVEIPHSAVVNFLGSMAERPGFTAEDIILSVTTVSFDISVLEIFLPLATGGKVVIASSESLLEALPVVERLARGDITVMQATPTLWQMLLEAGLEARPDLKVLVGGEPLPRDLADRLRAGGAEVWNMYGPTETTIWSSCGIVDDAPITIGDPIANTAMHVLDQNGQLSPPGTVGELCIGGAGLARCYYNRPDLTEAAFTQFDLPGVGCRRLYRTGDLAIRGADGSMRLLGRRDSQVKLRGFRIELGEIEAAMRTVPGLSAAAVDLRDGPNGKHLVGYYFAENSALESAGIAQKVASMLPDYMVPTRWHRLESLPQTMNGKLDRKALPDPSPGAPTSPVSLGAADSPQNPMEEQLRSIWAEVLGGNDIPTTATLFELGADSLSVFRIAARMIERGLGLEARDLLQHPTIRRLAEHALTRPDGARQRSVPSLKAYRNGARRQEARE
jgi:amino acid adenylation domain-containing protein